MNIIIHIAYQKSRHFELCKRDNERDDEIEVSFLVIFYESEGLLNI